MPSLSYHSSLVVSFSWLSLGTKKPLFGAAFSRLEKEKDTVSSPEKPPKRTAVYVDGYNLYYGRLRAGPYKWLDLVTLFEKILAERDQNECLARVNFFTAHALATFSGKGQTSVDAQSAYHRALKQLYGDRIDIVYGSHAFDKDGTLLPIFETGVPYDRSRRTRVWKLEEKKTDVNLAISMYRDAGHGLYDRIILVSNDSDTQPALKALREDFPHIMIGVVSTVCPPPEGAKQYRRTSASLVKLADWVLPSLSAMQLEAAQLPPMIPTKKKPIRKPLHW